MPILQSFHEQYGEQVAVLGIDYEDTQSEARWSSSQTLV